MEISRVTRSKKAARASYNKMSRWYDALSGRAEQQLADMGLGKLAVAPGEKVLEIGFGTGNALVALARSVSNTGIVYGIDLADGMIDVARGKLAREELGNRARMVLADAARLPLKADLLDAIFMSFTLELFDTPEIPTVLSECRRVLGPDGRLCVVAMAKTEQSNLMTRLYAWSHTILPNYVDCRPIPVRQSIEDAGFHIIEVTDASTWGLPVQIVLAHQ